MLFILTHRLASGERRGHFLPWSTWSKAIGELVGCALALGSSSVRLLRSHWLDLHMPTALGSGAASCPTEVHLSQHLACLVPCRALQRGRVAMLKRLSHSVGSCRHLCALLVQLM